jgi:hypothetical protein
MEETFETMTGGSECLPSSKTIAFSHIRRSLDSDYSYLVFENTSLTNEMDDFKKICAVLNAPDAGVLNQTIYRDRETGHFLLVARLSPDSDRMWKEWMLAADLPKRINFYFYGKCP